MTQDAPQPNPAEAYEKTIAQNVFVPWRADLLERAAPKPGERVLDVACGTGIVTRVLVGLVGSEGKVVGLDLNPMMLGVARTLVPTDQAPVEFVEASGTDMPLEDGSFDLVVCQQGLQFFPDLAAGLSEMRRVLVPGGRAVVSTWRGLDEQPLMALVDGVVSKHIAEGAFEAGFKLAHDEVFAQLARDSGFAEATVEVATIDLSIAEPEKFMPVMMMGAAAVLPQFASLSAEERSAKIGQMMPDLLAAIEPHIVSGNLIIKSATNVLVASA
jgi:ubiquinone/menaquinone biosynthesis C-methylase UbiE